MNLKSSRVTAKDIKSALAIPEPLYRIKIKGWRYDRPSKGEIEASWPLRLLVEFKKHGIDRSSLPNEER